VDIGVIADEPEDVKYNRGSFTVPPRP